jgi:hypothetical protein
MLMGARLQPALGAAVQRDADMASSPQLQCRRARRARKRDAPPDAQHQQQRLSWRPPLLRLRPRAPPPPPDRPAPDEPLPERRAFLDERERAELDTVLADVQE